MMLRNWTCPVILPLFILLWTSVSVPGKAQEPKEFLFPADSLPPKIVLVKGTLFGLYGKLDETDNPRKYSLRRGNRVLVAADCAKQWKLLWDTAKEETAIYRLSLIHTKPDQSEIVLAETMVELVSAPPSTIRTPLDKSLLAEDQPVHLQAAEGLKITGRVLYLDDHPLALNLDANGYAVWDTRTVLPGNHTLKGYVEIEGGFLYRLPPLSVTVRSQIEIEPFTTQHRLKVSGQNTEVTLKAKINSSLHIKQTTFLLDGWAIARILDPPYDQVKWDAVKAKPGTHRLEVEITDEAGKRTKSPAYEFTLIRESVVVSGQDKSHSSILPNNIAELRKEAARTQPFLTTRMGKKGVAKALAVNSLSVDGIPVEKAGEEFKIEVTFLLGTGQLHLIGPSQMGSSSQQAISNAFSFCKTKITQLGYTMDWGKYDTSLKYSVGGNFDGDSAGVVTTLALLSAALDLPLDQSIATTGAVTSNGDVRPIGGILFKAEAALRDPTTKTLMFPDEARTRQELLLRFTANPELFVNKRLITPVNIEQAMRQALIGFDEKTLLEAERLFALSLRAFSKGETTFAATYLKSAVDLTPENLTMRLWLDIIQSAK